MARRHTNAETAPVVPTTGMCPTCIVCIPMTKACASAPATRITVATRPTGSLRREKCTM